MRPDTDIDHYAVLGVPRDASASEIRRAYRRLARRHHPDLNPEPEDRARFVALARAYEILNDPARRARHDRTLAAAARDVRMPIRRPSTAPGAPRNDRRGMRGIIELTPREAEHAARLPLVLTSVRGGTIVLPPGIAHGDEVTVLHNGRPVMLSVCVRGKT